jgi:hypothetical protein
MSDKIPAVGSKAAVWHNNAKHTSGGLTKKDLMFRKGRIISRKKHAAGKKAIKHLVSLGYKAKKGSFTLFRKSMAQKRQKKGHKSRKRGHRGGGIMEYFKSAVAGTGATGAAPAPPAPAASAPPAPPAPKPMPAK